MLYSVSALSRRPWLWSDHQWQIAAVIAATPGIPAEWVWSVCNICGPLRKRLAAMLVDYSVSLGPVSKENAESITLADGWGMLRSTPRTYRGGVPLWAKMALEADDRTDAVVAEVLGISRYRVRKWRNTHVFDPLAM